MSWTQHPTPHLAPWQEIDRLRSELKQALDALARSNNQVVELEDRLGELRDEITSAFLEGREIGYAEGQDAAYWEDFSW